MASRVAPTFAMAFGWRCRNRFLNHFSEMATIRQLDLISFIDE